MAVFGILRHRVGCTRGVAAKGEPSPSIDACGSATANSTGRSPSRVQVQQGVPQMIVNGSRRNALASVGAIVLAASAGAKADVAPPVRIRMPIDTKQAVSGQPYVGVFEVDVARAGTLADFELEGDGWSIRSFGAPDAPTLTNVGVLRVPFQHISLRISRRSAGGFGDGAGPQPGFPAACRAALGGG